ncbi:bifunctional O-acetylhomoserine aminocarboxypropyltransferase/cysteine synthase [Campylobacter jejuni]|uniref:bifunctional O-acetylhomoserine aminocarboxypropyltransferase/cysteine synthase n=1 Tax=Campylobacter jejuni TaxID=197 RepID=UPI002D7CE80E|nr:O-acetylhomoserine aminocarboxypropyltransferase/cysteine synthase [Campylobacter jejuni]HEP7857854.1 O-acetylhomoserine aminocarboxypropyltransferase/cysteine synthase [Campylobacter jejuni]HEQ2086140.1 O-acetylhomoserine aminocarboxypropyltransferase/cysteine synthase [Campylobacter jejuni]HEQ2088184.1 O-acetylhomoserine aminocarboxypropyltransferase/cysteine synthase [Campylobacter jejuni]HEQ2093395.1 O-acetylhomoserine aminocarboxypropyltransferase/cysteine synthase [Campylobacter jejuni
MNFNKETLALHGAYNFDTQRSISVPIYQNTAYNFENLDQAAARFNLQELGNIYSRIDNPTSDVLGQRLANVEGGAFGIPVSSGMAACFYALVNLASSGDNVAYSNKIYGGTQTLISHTLKNFGIEAREFDIDDLDSLEKVIDQNTKAIFFESLSNPQIAIADIEKITQIAKKHKIVSICDNTVATPFLLQPFKHGVDIIVHSLSKYVSGQGSALGGVLIERKDLNDLLKNNDRYKTFNTPDPSYHGLNLNTLDLPIFSIRIIITWLRDLGASLAPQNAWLLLQGLETLAVRIEKHSQNAEKVANFLNSHPDIKGVNYPTLASNAYHNLFKKYFDKNFASGLLSFEARDYEHARRICDKTQLFLLAANLGDSKSLIIHPASTTHSQLSEEELQKAGIKKTTVRLSIGLENSDDLIADLKQAIES